MATAPPADPGATPVRARVLAPDLARGGMLLLIALANVHLYLHGHPLGVRGYPADLGAADRMVAAAQLVLVDGRAYPLFGLLFGYGVGQLARRRAAVGVPLAAVLRIVRRRGVWLVAIGLAHGLLLFAGDIVGAYGLLALLMARLLVAGSPHALRTTAAVGLALTALFGLVQGLPLPEAESFLPSMAIEGAAGAAQARLGEWVAIGLLGQAVGVFAAVALGAWAARYALLDEPVRHRRLLVRVAALGIGAAVLAGLPLGLLAAGAWDGASVPATALAASLHAVGGYAGGAGYAAAFGLLAIRVGRRTPGPLAGALVATGRRSLSCYLAQSLVFVPLLPAWTLGLGAALALWQAALLAVGTWALIAALAALADRAGHRGPAEILLRRLTYGRRTRGSTVEA